MRSKTKIPVCVAHFCLAGWLVGWLVFPSCYNTAFISVKTPEQPISDPSGLRCAWQAMALLLLLTDLSALLTSREPRATPVSSGSSHPSLCHWKAPHGAWAGKEQQSVVWQPQGSMQSPSQLLHPGRSSGLPGSPAAPTGTTPALGNKVVSLSAPSWGGSLCFPKGCSRWQRNKLILLTKASVAHYRNGAFKNIAKIWMFCRGCHRNL